MAKQLTQFEKDATIMWETLISNPLEEGYKGIGDDMEYFEGQLKKLVLKVIKREVGGDWKEKLTDLIIKRFPAQRLGKSTTIVLKKFIYAMICDEEMKYLTGF